jgi:hypothetical protein
MLHPLLTFWLLLKLWWGRILNPVFIVYSYPKFFQTPRRVIFKKILSDYFFKN